MRYKYVISTLYIFGTISLHSKESGLSNILQQVAKKERLVKPVTKKEIPKKQTRFVFKDVYDANGIGLKNKSKAKEKSESYTYDNKSRFKFKFNNGSEQNNFVGKYGASNLGGSMGGGQGGSHGSGARGGRR